MEDKLGVAYVGLGEFGEMRLKRTQSCEQVEMVGCYDIDPALTKSFAERTGARPYAAYEEALADPRVEGVVILTPNHTHAKLAVAAAQAGKHIYLTKPIANTVSDSLAIIDEVKKADRVLFVDHGMSLSPRWRRVHEMIEAGKIGKVISVAIRTEVPRKIVAGEWRADYETCPGGSLVQLAVYDLATLAWMFGLPERVFASARDDLTELPNLDAVQAQFAYASGLMVQLSTSYNVGVPVRGWLVTGTEGSILVGRAFRDRKGMRGMDLYESYRDRPALDAIEIDWPRKWTGDISYFHAAVRRKEPFEYTAAFALSPVILCEAILKSIREKAVVRPADVCPEERLHG